jgi:hypothetical protein
VGLLQDYDDDDRAAYTGFNLLKHTFVTQTYTHNPAQQLISSQSISQTKTVVHIYVYVDLFAFLLFDFDFACTGRLRKPSPTSGRPSSLERLASVTLS